jgi:hypothetical protein
MKPLFRASDDGLWTGIGQTRKAPTQTRGPHTYRTFALDVEALDELLSRAPMEYTLDEPVVMTVPMPDGSYTRVRIEESPIFSLELQAQHPELRAYRAEGIDDATATGRFDRTPAGFHAMLISERGTVYIDPTEEGQRSQYFSFWKGDVSGEHFECLHDGAEDGFALAAFPTNNPSGDQLRTYRLAVSATGEYTTFFGGVAGAQAQIMTTVNRVTGIYEREVAIRLTLVATNIYANPLADPFTGTDAGCGGVPGCAVGVMLGQNQTDLDANVLDANYDIGHIFSQGGGGGVAIPGVVCTSGSKAMGATSLGNPSGDVFDVDYVSHEMGHQFNASHTWNGTTRACSDATQFAPNSAYEPGSGSTIMAYAGICVPQNVQANSDDYFHTRSFDEITAFRDGAGACGTVATTGNTPPTVEAGDDCTVPTSTPFTLTAMGDDADGDSLTFAWEQFDLGTQDGFPSSTFTNGPLFRSQPPTSEPSRTFPRFEDILSGSADIAPGNPGFTWEVLPSVNRSLNFRVTVRDNQANGGGVDYDSMTVIVSGDPFTITDPGAGGTLECGDTSAISWDVGGGNVASDVEIFFSSDGGSSFSSLVATTPNDGSHSVTVPTELTSTGRIMLEPSSECFFAVSEEISVVDTTDPLLTAPADLPNVECTSPDGASPPDLGTPVVSDLCDASLDVSNDAPGVFPFGPTEVIWTATDDSDNSESAIQTVTVVDTTPPDITAPPDVTLECTSPEGTPVELGTPITSDVCDVSVDVGNDAPGLFPLGTTIVTWTATDDYDNDDSDTQTVVIEDTAPPEVELSVSPEVLWPPNHKMVTVRTDLIVGDVCDGSLTVRLISITSNEPDTARGDGNTVNDIQGADFGTDDREFQLRAERSGRGSGRVYTITYEVEDASGNATVRQAMVVVPKSQRRRTP